MKEFLHNEEQISYKISTAPRSGSHYLNACFASIIQSDKKYNIIGQRDMSHNFVFESNFWNLIVILRNPKEAILSGAIPIRNIKSSIETRISLSMANNIAWYKELYSIQDRIFYIIDFEKMVNDPVNEINSILRLSGLAHISENNLDESFIKSYIMREQDYISTSKNHPEYELTKKALEDFDISESMKYYRYFLDLRESTKTPMPFPVV